jgi:streptogramin lyase
LTSGLSQAGSGPGQIGFKVKESEGPYEAVPSAIAADTKGNVYIADIANDRIQKYDNNGNLVNSMKIENIRKGDPWVDDMTIDNNDNLYVAHGQTDQKIYKYNSAGALIQSIDLLNKNLCWDAKKGWSRCYMQIERITVDVIGNVYLVGRGQLIKFNPEGQEEKKWSTETRFEIPIIVLDEIGNLYLKSVVAGYRFSEPR